MKRRIAAIIVAVMILSSVAMALYVVGWPEATGSRVIKDGNLTIDASDKQNGYFMAKAAKSDKRYKLRVEYGGTTLTYDLNSAGNYEVYPLQFGSGDYKVSLYINAGGKKYSAAGSAWVSVQLDDEKAAFLMPNQYVNYTRESAAVALSDEICAGKSTPRERYEAIYSYAKKYFLYDYMKAFSISAGQLPDIDYCVENSMGICQDLAAVMACMLRVQGIPTKLMIGYINKQYHAWNIVYLDGEEILLDLTADLGGVAKIGEYAVERFY